MRVTIIINCDNAAFDDLPGREVDRILRRLADDLPLTEKYLRDFDGRRLFDINGNTVGLVRVGGRPRAS